MAELKSFEWHLGREFGFVLFFSLVFGFVGMLVALGMNFLNPWDASRQGDVILWGLVGGITFVLVAVVPFRFAQDGYDYAKVETHRDALQGSNNSLGVKLARWDRFRQEASLQSAVDAYLVRLLEARAHAAVRAYDTASEAPGRSWEEFLDYTKRVKAAEAHVTERASLLKQAQTAAKELGFTVVEEEDLQDAREASHRVP